MPTNRLTTQRPPTLPPLFAPLCLSPQAQSDLPALATASHALAKLFSEALDDAQRAGKQAEYAERKEGELAAAVAAAAATPAHAAALAWRPAAK